MPPTKTDTTPITVPPLDAEGLYFPQPVPSSIRLVSPRSRSHLTGLVCTLCNHSSQLPLAGTQSDRAAVSSYFGVCLMAVAGDGNLGGLDRDVLAFVSRLTVDEAAPWKAALGDFKRLSSQEQIDFVHAIFDSYRAAGAGVAKRRAMLRQADEFLASIEKTLAGGGAR